MKLLTLKNNKMENLKKFLKSEMDNAKIVSTDNEVLVLQLRAKRGIPFMSGWLGILLKDYKQFHAVIMYYTTCNDFIVCSSSITNYFVAEHLSDNIGGGYMNSCGYSYWYSDSVDPIKQELLNLPDIKRFVLEGLEG